MKAKREKINKVVKFEGNTITVLEEAFEYPEGYVKGIERGLVGSLFEPISKARYKEQTKLSTIEDYLRSAFREEDVPYEYLYLDSGKESKNPYKRWAKAIKEAGEEEEVMFDTSYSELWDYLREELNLSEDEAYIFNCVGGGRCFSADDKFTHNRELEKYLIYEKE